MPASSPPSELAPLLACPAGPWHSPPARPEQPAVGRGGTRCGGPGQPGGAAGGGCLRGQPSRHLLPFPSWPWVVGHPRSGPCLFVAPVCCAVAPGLAVSVLLLGFLGARLVTAALRGHDGLSCLRAPPAGSRWRARFAACSQRRPTACSASTTGWRRRSTTLRRRCRWAPVAAGPSNAMPAGLPAARRGWRAPGELSPSSVQGDPARRRSSCTAARLCASR